MHVPDSDLEITTMRASGAGAPCIIPFTPWYGSQAMSRPLRKDQRLHADA